MTSKTVVLIVVAIIIVGVAVFSWRFENMGEDSVEQNISEDSDQKEN